MGTAEALAVCINSARTGFYLRVLTEGLIRAGDAIEIERQDVAAPTVEEIHRLYYLDKRNLDDLARALNCKPLARAFKSEFERRAEKLAAAQSD